MAEYQSESVCEATTYGQGKENHLKGFKGTILEAPTGAVVVPMDQSGNPHGSWGSRLSANDTAYQEWDTINPRLKTALVQPKNASAASLERINPFPSNFCVF